MTLQSLYHRLVPPRIRDPFGLARRDVTDRIRRALAREPVPPRAMLAPLQSTPWAAEYLAVGRRAARAIQRAFAAGGLDPAAPARILDLGSGAARVVRHLRDTAWVLDAADWDEGSVRWAKEALPEIRFSLAPPRPPLPWAAGSFDAAYATTAFVHLADDDRAAWGAELARVVRPGGLVAVSTFGLEAAALGPSFELLQWTEHGLDGFQDLALLRRSQL